MDDIHHPDPMSRRYALLAGAFLAAQGVSTLLARTVPAIDAAVPALLAQTRMVPSHSLLHIVTAVVALVALRRGGRPTALHFSAGFGLFYIGLALAGSASGSDLCLGLQPFDHPFHLVLGGLGLAAAATDRWRRAPRRPPPDIERIR